MIAPLLASIAPFLLWPIELFFPYPYIVEEITKAVIVLVIVSVAARRLQINLTVVSGFLFTVSETVLFSFMLIGYGESPILLQRLVLTAPLHIGTMLIMLTSTFVDKKLIIIGLIISVVIHYLFNLGVQGFNPF